MKEDKSLIKNKDTTEIICKKIDHTFILSFK